MTSLKTDSSLAACVAHSLFCGLDKEGSFGVSCPWTQVWKPGCSELAKIYALKPLAPQEKSLQKCKGHSPHSSLKKGTAHCLSGLFPACP